MIVIDLTGPQGNAFALLGQVQKWGRQLGVDTTDTLADMRSGDYAHLLDVMRAWCEAHHLDVDLIGPPYTCPLDDEGDDQ